MEANSNSYSHYRFVCCMLLQLVCVFQAHDALSQNDEVAVAADTAGLVELQPYPLLVARTNCIAPRKISNYIIDNANDFKQLTQDCGQDVGAIDFSSHVAFVGVYYSDCLMQVLPHVFQDPKRKRITVVAFNIWGRCRAGGRRVLLLRLDKPPAGYVLEEKEVKVDSFDEYKSALSDMKANGYEGY